MRQASYESISHLSDSQIEDLYSMFKLEFWTQGRELADIRVMLENTSLIVAFADSDGGRLVGFSRVLTDYVYKALILDVIVVSSERGKDLGRALLDGIINHPRLTAVRHFELYCKPEMALFYKKWGFTNDLGELLFMRHTWSS